jgi:hypothetical protein
MEYYLYRNGPACIACVLDSPADAKGLLETVRKNEPTVKWFMED